MKTINEDKPSISMRLDRTLAFASYIIYIFLGILSMGILAPLAFCIPLNSSALEVRDAFLHVEMLWIIMPSVALLIFILIGILIIRVWIALVGWISGGKYKHKDIKESKIK